MIELLSLQTKKIEGESLLYYCLPDEFGLPGILLLLSSLYFVASYDREKKTSQKEILQRHKENSVSTMLNTTKREREVQTGINLLCVVNDDHDRRWKKEERQNKDKKDRTHKKERTETQRKGRKERRRKRRNDKTVPNEKRRLQDCFFSFSFALHCNTTKRRWRYRKKKKGR